MNDPIIITFGEVGPWTGDSFETFFYRSCDFCSESGMNDIWKGILNEDLWRAFYDLGDGTVICGECLPQFLEEYI